jgi:hypothetical protein
VIARAAPLSNSNRDVMVLWHLSPAALRPCAQHSAVLHSTRRRCTRAAAVLDNRCKVIVDERFRNAFFVFRALAGFRRVRGSLAASSRAL